MVLLKKATNKWKSQDYYSPSLLNGNTEKSNFYLKDITAEIPFKTKVLLSTPIFILKLLLKVKHLLKKNGIDFSVYH